MNLRPMRACKVEDTDLQKLKFPLYLSPKYDGWRCVIKDGVALTNKLLPIPNRFVQSILGKHNLEGLDGEIVLKGSLEYNKVQSALSRQSGEPDFLFIYFDLWNHPGAFGNRLCSMQFDKDQIETDRVQMCDHIPVLDMADFYDYEEKILALGYEGICGRSPFEPYKMGRSTLNQLALIKRKPFKDAEAQIIGFYEQEENLNERTVDNTSLSKRSSHQGNKRGKDTLGGFLVRSNEFGDFNIGTGLGLTQVLRQKIWDNQDRYLGKWITYKYQKMGTLNKPRIPIFRYFRNALDIPLED